MCACCNDDTQEIVEEDIENYDMNENNNDDDVFSQSSVQSKQIKNNDV